MLNLKKTKKIKGSKRGITFSDRDMFPIHSKFRYVIDKVNKRIVIALTEVEGQQVAEWQEKVYAITKQYVVDTHEASISRKASGQEFIPLVDIRNKEALDVFNGYEQLHVSIGDDVIIVECEEPSLSIWEKAKGFLHRKKHKKRYAFDKKQVLAEVGLQVAESPQDHLQVASFFSGAGIMDMGFLNAGYEIVFALEKNAEAAGTYRFNHGEHIHVGDICDFDYALMQNVPLVIGGPPCQGFSAANRQTNFLENPNNLLVRKYIEAIQVNQGCKVFVLENVPQLLTMGNGQFLEEIKQALHEFEITYGVLCSADYGSPQLRKRAIIIGSKIGRIELPTPTHNPGTYQTVREAFAGLHDGIANQTDYTIPKPETAERMAYVQQGGNWKDIPHHLRAIENKGKTHSSIFKRLLWDKPSITITNVRKSNILHPCLNRILSVREAARLFDLPDWFEFRGSLAAKQQQIANAVTVKMAQAIAEQIKKAFKRIQYSLV